MNWSTLPRIRPARSAAALLLPAHRIERLAEVRDDAEAFDDLQRLARHPRDNGEVRLPEVAVHEAQSGDDLRPEGVESVWLQFDFLFPKRTPSNLRSKSARTT